MLETKTNPTIKTITIQAKPVWETKKNLKPYLAKESMDRQRVEKYKDAKEVLDNYARKVIEVATSIIKEEDLAPTLDNLESLYNSVSGVKNRADYTKEADAFKKYIAKSIKQIADEYQLVTKYGQLFTEDKSAIFRNAQALGIEKESLEVLSLYNKFTSYFSRYFTTLSDVILCGTGYGSIAHRIMENMEYYWKNWNTLMGIKEKYPDLYIMLLDNADLMTVTMAMSQKGIDEYNSLIGNTNATGINSIISSYAQKNRARIALLKTMNKIPLSLVKKQVVVDVIENEEEFSAVVSDSIPMVEDILSFAKRMMQFHWDKETKDSTYLLNKNLNVLSNHLYKKWDMLEKAKDKVEISEYEKNERLISVSTLEAIMASIDEEPKKSLLDVVKEKMNEALRAEGDIKKILTLADAGTLKTNRKQLKEFYDKVIMVRQAVSFFYCNEVENVLVEDIASMKDTFAEFNKCYNMTRNYCTKNPIVKDDIPMFFNKGTFLNSFDSDKFKEGISLSTLLRKDGMYYLYILNPAIATKLSSIAYTENGGYDRLVYKQLTGINKMFPKCFVYAKAAEEEYGLTPEIKEIVSSKSYTKEANDRAACVKWIQYCIDCFRKNEEWMKYYHVPFRKAEDYESANDFYTQTEKCTTHISWSEHLDEAYVRNSVAKGEAFLFQLYNHDFSPNHKERDGNYTRILKEALSDDNLMLINDTDKTAVKLLSGGSTLTYREASLPFKETHAANEPLLNKNPLNKKRTSTFPYALSKDRRFMSDSFTLRIGFQIGFRNKEIHPVELNRVVNEEILKKCPNVLTVRTGEEHLLYYMVTDPDNNILEQGSLNTITSKTGEKVVMEKDYKSILKEREEDIAYAKKEWNYSIDIKDVKTGYVAYAVHEVLNIRDKYDAVIFLEDYSSDFINKRRANVKAVYQQFSAALINKLSCYVKPDSLYRDAIQLSAPVAAQEELKGQRGIVFFVNSAYTSNADPTSGFINVFHDSFRYENMKKAADICEKLKVNFDDKKKQFLIVLKEDDFGLKTGKEWTLGTYGLRTYYKNKTIKDFDCTEQLASLMKDYNMSDFKEFAKVADKKFYKSFFEIMQVLLKMHYSEIDEMDGYFISPITGIEFGYPVTEKPSNSSAVKTYLVMLKGVRDLQNIDAETFLIKRENTKDYLGDWEDYLSRNLLKK